MSELIEKLSPEQMSQAFLALEYPEENWPLPEPLNQLSEREWKIISLTLDHLLLEKQLSNVH
jgi:hypothetical protein